MCTERSPVGHWRHRLRNTGSAEAKRQQNERTNAVYVQPVVHDLTSTPHNDSFAFCVAALPSAKRDALHCLAKQVNQITPYIIFSGHLVFKIKMLGWVITETETNYEDKFHSVKSRWFLSPPVVEFSWRWLQPSASGTGPELYFEDSMVPFRMHIYVDFTLLCAKQRSRQSDEQRTLWPTRWRCLLLFMQSRLHRHRSQSQRWQSFCFVFQNSAVGHVA